MGTIKREAIMAAILWVTCHAPLVESALSNKGLTYQIVRVALIAARMMIGG
jgi:hypothetical protein